MKLSTAQRGADRLLALFSPTGEGCVAGSVRRQKPEPNDIELVLPLPDPDDQVDQVFEAMQKFVWVEPPADAPTLFGPTRTEDQRFVAVKGFKLGFKSCQIQFKPHYACEDPAWLDMKVDVFRYVPGSQGNFGWILLMRTGSAEFSHAALSQFIRSDGRPPDSRGSIDGFLVDAQGRPIPTPTEESAFSAMGLEWVEPCDRPGIAQVKRKRLIFTARILPPEERRTLTPEEQRQLNQVM